MASATPDLRLPSRPQSITALWPVPNYTAWQMGVATVQVANTHVPLLLPDGVPAGS